MSMKPAISSQTICDLCGGVIPLGPENRSCLNVGMIAAKQHARTQRFTFLPNWWGKQQIDSRSKSPQWDFHTSCLTEVLRPLVEGETE